ncbi:hypothetical protein J3E72DRAFT_19245 [Bipolaris maydis]|uniref:uncharacterized protein n=1 Tax=Cochliobolus heterostrophus TaxID=5016 RepID=UPI0024DC96C7|nr:hypothetical protein J3E73DRAFT_427684 [Bipolaris maydis]KAJ5055455.1 hypothetical protein J3E74DRAFT_478078 [Bipolaris maydis]KAJ6193169.1 hypothetical protein J3E72DRAFT_19245 [Bipolaris maydis]KAJ6265986.1 hypothetical protein PSV08DRAFT_405884 [Bipolaris maydis]KAJ6276636.1 hypothetical protein J3E71DRAFT_18790 [Bipolaris maydis]
MFWFLLFLLSLASCSPVKVDLAKRGNLACTAFPSTSADLPVFQLDLRETIERNAFEYGHTPTLQELPLTTWAGSGPGHHVTFRAWRTFGQGGTFWVYLEVQVTAPLDLFINFGAQSQRQGSDPGLSRIDNGIAQGSGSSTFPRRTTFAINIGTIHQNIDYTAAGNWRR